MDLVFMVLAGVLFLLEGLRSTFKICKKDCHIGWRILFALIILFVVGYFSVLYYFYYQPPDGIIASIIASILLGGGAFVSLISRFSYQSILKIEKSIAFERHQALHDNLTGLPNRKNFFSTLTDYIDHSRPCTVLFIDLNNFKQVNDELGHYYGDQLLIAIAEKLNHRLSYISSFYRMGGDEFSLILDQKNRDKCAEIVQIIHDELKDPFPVVDNLISVSLSIGASRFPEDTLWVDELMKQADMAMYVSKKQNKNIVFYTAALGDKANEELVISSQLKQAIEHNQFELYYQPILNSDGISIHGAEVLLRWPQSDGSFISPDVFIKIAEQTNLILQITAWVFKKVITDLEILKDQGFGGVLHINLSSKDLENDYFYENVIDQLNRVPWISEHLIFEVTESTMMTNLLAAKTMMNKLSLKGFKFSIDDFGTGFSSLSLLRELPIDQIKIDCSFVINMNENSANFAIVESTIFLAKRLGCNVIAEGVETKQVEEQLIGLSCDFMQGYYYSKPVELSRFMYDYLP